MPRRPRGYLLTEDGKEHPVQIVGEVARGFGLTFNDVAGDSRDRVIMRARKIAMTVVRDMTDLSYPAIGELFGKDHTTVMHHVASVRADPRKSRAVALVIEQLTATAEAS